MYCSLNEQEFLASCRIGPQKGEGCRVLLGSGSPGCRIMSPVAGWSAPLAGAKDERMVWALRRNTNTGWPTGAPDFVANLEARLGRTLTRRRAGRKPKNPVEGGNT